MQHDHGHLGEEPHQRREEQWVGEDQVRVGVAVPGVELHRKALGVRGLHDQHDDVIDEVLLLHAVPGHEAGPLEGCLRLVPLRLGDREAASVGGDALQAHDPALTGGAEVGPQRLVEIREPLMLADQPGGDGLDPLDPADLPAEARSRLVPRRHRRRVGIPVVDQEPCDAGRAQEEPVELVARALGAGGDDSVLVRLAPEHLRDLAEHPQVVGRRRRVVGRERIPGALREPVPELGNVDRLRAREDTVAVVVDDGDVTQVEQHQNL